jgi:hypothetical protein
MYFLASLEVVITDNNNNNSAVHFSTLEALTWIPLST